MVFQPTSLVELAARVIKVHDVPYEDWEVRLPMGIFFTNLYINESHIQTETSIVSGTQSFGKTAKVLSQLCQSNVQRGIFQLKSWACQGIMSYPPSHLFLSPWNISLLFSNSLSTSAEGSECHWCNTVRYISLKPVQRISLSGYHRHIFCFSLLFAMQSGQPSCSGRGCQSWPRIPKNEEGIAGLMRSCHTFGFYKLSFTLYTFSYFFLKLTITFPIIVP